ncbi:MAG TPA: SUMF1/EgtB/PvdO family nonheme iron enzyme, partial [Anaerolineales bacterium]|nr:SUMF1/EgtB/PvdO family nonheme iron enzyme [Anaerolineales bacterium]
HLRARLQAGYLLGRLGDPRFIPQEIKGVKVILPTMVPVPAGRYRIGSQSDEEEAYDDERPATWVELPEFSIGKWPVTNAEYACFMAAGGYENEEYWVGEMGRRWLKGEEVAGGQLKTYLDNINMLRANPGWQDRVKDVWTPQTIETYEYLLELSAEQAIAELSKFLTNKSRRQPAYWDDPQYNNPSQPVVGVTWFEAQAYCAWLTALCGKTFRLPSEAEWEAAGRGSTASANRIYPWGAGWEPARANTIEGRVLKPSPVGAYAAAGGVGPYGAEDQAGNVWNWTSSLYRPYPYDPGQSEQPEAQGERVLRGGSWINTRWNARCASRFGNVPGDFLDVSGFRVLSPGILPDSGC